ncbi:GT-D fold domain-containing protein [Paenibacillus tuaregi]|uniref:GT-D fold domain-containing protein n=1 Tax=Paenibacillus tuaregi TaxID=1816681 RepID=UPI000AD97DF6|nr:GT-D fold domain-containing glycosyltransferase [Paenibacillus tuaregi]
MAGHTAEMGGMPPISASPGPRIPSSGNANPAPAGVYPLAGEAETLIRQEAFTEGYWQGLYEGGEGRVSRLIPPYYVLPELTADHLIEAGFRQHVLSLMPLLSPSAVSGLLMDALSLGRPFSLVRLGDGELLTLAHDTVLTVEEARARGPFLTYAGVQLPDHPVRDRIAASLLAADLIGIPESRHPNYQGLLFPVLRHYGIDYRSLRLTSSTINYALNEQGYLMRVLQGRRVLIVGNKAAGLAQVLAINGVQVSGCVGEVNGAADTDSVMNRIRELRGSFDIALVAAGIAAVILCPIIAQELGVAAVDFGHLANKLENGEVQLGLP